MPTPRSEVSLVLWCDGALSWCLNWTVVALCWCFDLVIEMDSCRAVESSLLGGAEVGMDVLCAGLGAWCS